MADVKFHALAEIFPLMGGKDFDELVADIKAHGLREPITRHQGQVIDGRNRYLACKKAKVDPFFVEWNEQGSLTSFVISANLHRRHLNPSERGMVAVEIEKHFAAEAAEREKQRDGDGGFSEQNSEKPRVSARVAFVPPPSGTKSRDRAAEAVGVSGRMVQNAKAVTEHGDPELVEAVKDGSITVTDAAKVAKEPKEAQRKAVQAVKAGKSRTVAQAVEAHGAKEGPQDRAVKSDFDILHGLVGKIVRKVDAVAADLGGHGPKTKPVRDALEQLSRAIHSWRRAPR